MPSSSRVASVVSADRSCFLCWLLPDPFAFGISFSICPHLRSARLLIAAARRSAFRVLRFGAHSVRAEPLKQFRRVAPGRWGRGSRSRKAGAIRAFAKNVVRDVIEIGRHLSEAKERVGHGQYLQWLSSEFEWSESTALRFVQTFDAFGSHVTDFGFTSALLLQARRPLDPRGRPRRGTGALPEAGERNGYCTPALRAPARSVLVPRSPAAGMTARRGRRTRRTGRRIRRVPQPVCSRVEKFEEPGGFAKHYQASPLRHPVREHQRIAP
jgi:Protein of unknown function (DUF3102)